jgi:hypothetical protein
MPPTPPIVRPCREDEADTLLAIINAAAQAYRGAIPADCWHEPYMSAAELRSEIAAGIDFVACEAGWRGGGRDGHPAVCATST